jgi:hypothetical protein
MSTLPGAAREERGAIPSALRYAFGDYAVGAIAAIAVAASIHAIVDPGWDMVTAMLVGAAIGTAVHLVAVGVASPFVGFFQVMTTTGLIGMQGGMLFGMRDSMQAASWTRVLLVAVLLGVVVVGVLRLYDRALRSSARSD